MKDQRDAHRILVKTTKVVYARKDVKRKIAELKIPKKELKRDDFVWHRLLCSFSTWGNSKGYEGLIGDPNNYRLVTYDALSRLSRSQRLSKLRIVLQKAGVRYPKRKAGYLAENFDKIEKMGGVVQARKDIGKLEDRNDLLKFFNNFKGIGPKYARNIYMDVYHPKFRQCIALDSRIKEVSKELDLPFNKYDDFEDFYLSVAHSLGIDGWTLDRMIYNFKDDFIREIRRQSQRK